MPWNSKGNTIVIPKKEKVVKRMEKVGKVWLAGAGPGDAGLLTMKTRALLEEADVIVYDALISTEIMSLIPNEKECIYVGKRSGNHAVPQEGINQILLEQAQAGKKVLRLKGGDPFVFGRGGEELELLVKHQIPFEIVPGITSAVAVAAYAGIPITHRDFTSSFHVITGHARKDGVSRIDYDALVKMNGTLVFLMGISSMPDICRGLLDAGMRPDMPAAVLERGTTSKQRNIVSDVTHLVERAEEEQVQTPAIILVGEVCALENDFTWAKKRPLGGRQFLITRPKQNASELAHRLRKQGAQVLEVPAISTRPIANNAALKEVLDAIRTGKNGIGNAEKLVTERWLVFSSPIGVRTFFEQLVDMEMDLRHLMQSGVTLKVAAIGSATKKELRNYGLCADVTPKVYNAKYLGEAIAEVSRPDSEIIIVRAKEGSKELIPPLEEAGLMVKDIATYETVYEVNEILCEEVKAAFERGEIDAVTFTSASTVRGFVNGLKELDYTRIKAICIGEQTAAEALKYGMQIHISKEASMDSMMELILEQFGN